jgi:hypothetical protein
MKKDSFGYADIGMTVTHGLGLKMTVVGLDPRNQGDSFYTSNFAYCRYKNEVSGALEIGSFHAQEFEFPKEEEEEEEE